MTTISVQIPSLQDLQNRADETGKSLANTAYDFATVRNLEKTLGNNVVVHADKDDYSSGEKQWLKTGAVVEIELKDSDCLDLMVASGVINTNKTYSLAEFEAFQTSLAEGDCDNEIPYSRDGGMEVAAFEAENPSAFYFINLQGETVLAFNPFYVGAFEVSVMAIDPYTVNTLGESRAIEDPLFDELFYDGTNDQAWEAAASAYLGEDVIMVASRHYTSTLLAMQNEIAPSNENHPKRYNFSEQPIHLVGNVPPVDTAEPALVAAGDTGLDEY